MAWWFNKHAEGLPIWTDWCRNGRDHLEEMIRDLGHESFQQAHASMYDILQSEENTKRPYMTCGWKKLWWNAPSSGRFLLVEEG